MIRAPHRRVRWRRGLTAAVLALVLPGASHADCFDVAGLRYGVSPLLLRAVALQESGMNPHASHRNTNGSTDIGLMQINASWLPVLARHGIQPGDLWEPCTNVMVGAWILGTNFQAMGRNISALGAYNAKDPKKREAYARQVLKRYDALNGALNAELYAAVGPPAR